MSDVRSCRFAGLAADSRGHDDGRPPLVLLHGLSFDRRQWHPVLRELAIIDPHRRVLSFDLPGHGDSPPHVSHKIEDLAELVHQAVTAAGLQAPIIVGHSLGGALATFYAAQFPAHAAVNVDQPLFVERFQAMLLRAEPLLRGPHYADFWQGLLGGMRVDLLPPDAQEIVRATGTPSQTLLLSYWEELLRRTGDSLAGQWGGVIETIRAKGMHYHYVSGDAEPANLRWLIQVMPEATITLLPNSGHFPHLARPAEFAGILASRR